MDSRTETKERMPEKPSWCSLQRWTEYKWRATSAEWQGLSRRCQLAAEYGLPVIPASVLSI